MRPHRASDRHRELIHRTRLAAVVALAAFLGAAGPATSPLDVREPDGLYEGPQDGYTPKSLQGASVVDLAGVARLMSEKAVLIDVGLANRKPAGLPETTLWLPTHRTIPGAVWLPNAGAAPLTPEQEDTFLRRVADLSGRDRGRPIVIFCKPDCWGGWNAGKRLVAAGYSRVHWFPLGIDAWQEAHDTVVAKPDPAWAKVIAGSRLDAGFEIQR